MGSVYGAGPHPGSCGHAPGAAPGPGYGPPPGGTAYCGFAPAGGEACDVFVEVSPEIQPGFNRGPNGTFIMDLPPIKVKLCTTCTPPPPADPGLTPFKPYEEFYVHLPEVTRVVFDPATGMPPGATAAATTRKRGAVLEVPQRVTLNAQIKSNSPYGSLVLEDLQVTNTYKQKIGETTLNYRLQVEGQLSVNRGGGNGGSNRLEVDLNFHFSCVLGMGVMPLGPAGPPGPSLHGGHMPHGSYGM